MLLKHKEKKFLFKPKNHTIKWLLKLTLISKRNKKYKLFSYQYKSRINRSKMLSELLILDDRWLNMLKLVKKVKNKLKSRR